MTPSSDQPHTVRRVVLPSGKTIEVVYFADGAPEASTPAPSRPVEVHRCPQCGSDLVHPTAWEEAGEDMWRLSLRCPNCEWRGTGRYDRETVERFDEELDRGTHALVTDLRHLMHANMEAEIERFVAALDADHIWPIDF